MSFDRIGKLGNSSTMKARLQEEVRLAELAQSTTVRYTEMGVYQLSLVSATATVSFFIFGTLCSYDPL